MKIDYDLAPGHLLSKLDRFWSLSGEKIKLIENAYDPEKGSPVFTVNGSYTTRGWTEWTQGFQYGCLILAGDGLNDAALIELGRERTIQRMLPHVTHVGVHDHGFNTLSTYGHLLRLLNEGRLGSDDWQRENSRTLRVDLSRFPIQWVATHLGVADDVGTPLNDLTDRRHVDSGHPAVGNLAVDRLTVDELFELLTLVQTGKLQQRPIVLVGKDYWRGLYQWLLEQPQEQAFIGARDLEYLEIVEDAEAAAVILLDYYRRECPEHIKGD